MKLVLTVTFFIGLIQLCSALKCYQCHTDNNDYCLDGNRTDKFDVVDCKSNGCLKVRLYSLGGVSRMTRDCFKDDLCDEFSVCLSCDEDLCNGSNALKSISVLLLSVILVIIFICT